MTGKKQRRSNSNSGRQLAFDTLESRVMLDCRGLGGDTSFFESTNGDNSELGAGAVIWTLRNRQYTERYLHESPTNNAELAPIDDIASEWVVEPLGEFVTMRNCLTGNYLRADNWQAGTQPDASDTLNIRWTVLESSDGSITLRNADTFRYLDGDGPADNWDVDESSAIGNDDGWFVTEEIIGESSPEIWILRNRVYSDRSLHERDANAELSESDGPQSQWDVTRTPAGIYLQNRATGNYLASSNYDGFTTESQLPAALWSIAYNQDGSIALLNLETGRYLDGDGPGDNWDVDESSAIGADDGWFVTEVASEVWTLRNVQYSEFYRDTYLGHPNRYLSENSTNAELSLSVGTQSRWRVTETSDGVHLQNIATGNYLVATPLNAPNNVYTSATLPPEASWSILANPDGSIGLLNAVTGYVLDGDESSANWNVDQSVINPRILAEGFTAGDDAWWVTNLSGNDSVIISEPPSGELSGTVFVDLNSDSQQDANEVGVANRTIYYDANSNQLFDDGELNAVTDSNGQYRIEGFELCISLRSCNEELSIGLVPDPNYEDSVLGLRTHYEIPVFTPASPTVELNIAQREVQSNIEVVWTLSNRVYARFLHESETTNVEMAAEESSRSEWIVERDGDFVSLRNRETGNYLRADDWRANTTPAGNDLANTRWTLVTPSDGFVAFGSESGRWLDGDSAQDGWDVNLSGGQPGIVTSPGWDDMWSVSEEIITDGGGNSGDGGNGGEIGTPEEIWTLRNRRYCEWYLDEDASGNAFLGREGTRRDRWVVIRVDNGIYLRNQDTGNYLAASNYEAYTVATQTPETLWREVDDGGFVGLQNVLSGRFLDGDGGSENFNVDESEQLLHDDGWNIRRFPLESTAATIAFAVAEEPDVMPDPPTPLDALRIVNELNLREVSDAATSELMTFEIGSLQLDRNDDALVTPIDALMMINEIDDARETEVAVAAAALDVSFLPDRDDSESAAADSYALIDEVFAESA